MYNLHGWKHLAFLQMAHIEEQIIFGFIIGGLSLLKVKMQTLMMTQITFLLHFGLLNVPWKVICFNECKEYLLILPEIW